MPFQRQGQLSPLTSLSPLLSFVQPPVGAVLEFTLTAEIESWLSGQPSPVPIQPAAGHDVAPSDAARASIACRSVLSSHSPARRP